MLERKFQKKKTIEDKVDKLFDEVKQDILDGKLKYIDTMIIHNKLEMWYREQIMRQYPI